MKRKYFLVGLVLILIMFLVGCSGIGLPDTEAPITDEEKINPIFHQMTDLCLEAFKNMGKE